MAFTIEEDYAGFDWDSTEGDRHYPPLPEGWYPARITKAEVKTVAGKEGEFRKLVLTLEVTGGPYEGRLIFDDVMLNNKEGSKRRRALVWRRLGLVDKGATKAAISEQDLIGRECAVEVKVEEYPKKDGTKGQRNIVTFAGYKPVSELEPGDEAAPEGAIDEKSCPF